MLAFIVFSFQMFRIKNYSVDALPGSTIVFWKIQSLENYWKRTSISLKISAFNHKGKWIIVKF